MIKYIKIAFIFIVTLLFSCEAPQHSFTAEELKQIDSLYNLSKDSIKNSVQYECDSTRAVIFNGLVDSLKEERKKEILDILGE